jgi:hypothetical protein
MAAGLKGWRTPEKSKKNWFALEVKDRDTVYRSVFQVGLKEGVLEKLELKTPRGSD